MSEFFGLVLSVAVPFLVMFQLIPLLIWLERKGSAYIQDRPGPNRANILGLRLGGLIHSLADVLKLLFKEDITPHHVHKFYYTLAPCLSLIVACITFVVIPYGPDLVIPTGKTWLMQPARLNAGILYVLAVSSLGVFGIMLAAFASNNKYALLGGLRSSSQMISYELAMGLSVVSIVLASGHLQIEQMVEAQGASILNWNFIQDPVAFFIFTICAFAETNRAPFDLPESESELVAGYHIEYSSMKFAMFFMAEYANMIVASALIASLFLGGYQVPFLSHATLQLQALPIAKVLLGATSFLFLYLSFKCFYKSRHPVEHFYDARDSEPFFLGLVTFVIALTCLAGVFFLQPTPWVIFFILAFLYISVFLGKTLLVCWLFIWVRWTLPRMRYDHLMKLGWKYLLPLSLANVVLTVLRRLF